MIDNIQQSGDWQIIRPHIDARINELRELLEGGGHDINHDNKIRGEIAGLRWLITEVESPKPDAPPAGYVARHGHPS